MKRIFKAMATTAVTLMAMQANAIQVTYSFRVNSSGPSIYPCNAGLTTDDKAHGDKYACWTRLTHERCDGNCVGMNCEGGDNGHDGPDVPNPNGGHGHDGPGQGGPHGPGPGPQNNPIAGVLFGGDHQQHDETKNACECTTEYGRKNGNYFHAEYDNWETGNDPHSDVISGSHGHFSTLFGEQTAYQKVLKKLAFNLGSETYNAKYFVDICYRGSQIDYSVINTKWNILAETAVSDFGAGANNHEGYSKLADLKMKAYVICTNQNKTCQHGNCDDKDSLADLATFNQDFLKVLYDNKDYADSTPGNNGGWKDPKGSFQDLIRTNNVDLGNQAAAKFCKVRYVFSETNGNDEHHAIPRKWQKHGANICTHTKIEMAGMGKCTNCGDGKHDQGPQHGWN